MPVPTLGPIVQAFSDTYATGASGANRTLVEELAEYGTTRSAYVNGYHAAYEAALEKAVDEKILNGISSVFTFGGILDLTDSTNDVDSILDGETYNAIDGIAFNISLAVNFPTEVAGAGINVGTYYKLSFPGDSTARYRVKLNTDDTTVDASSLPGIVVQDGDAVVVYDTGSFKRLDRIDNVQTSLTEGDAYISIVQTGSSYAVALQGTVKTTIDATITEVTGTANQIEIVPTLATGANTVLLSLASGVTDVLALVDTTESASSIRGSVNITLTGIIQRLQTVTAFMEFMESAGGMLDANGDPVTFSDVMNLDADPAVTTETLPVANNVVQFPTASGA